MLFYKKISEKKTKNRNSNFFVLSVTSCFVSSEQSFHKLTQNQEVKIIRTTKDLKACDALILPGVGSFDPAMENLHKTNMVPDIKNWAKENKPLLGICLGLQLLFESSDEGRTSGLGLLKGHVQKLPSNQGERIPHMGWAPLHQENKCPLLVETDRSNWMYFVHSYSAIPKNKKDLAATVPFGNKKVTAIVWQGRLGACQFHPEKSAKAGRLMLSRWLQWLEAGANPIN